MADTSTSAAEMLPSDSKARHPSISRSRHTIAAMLSKKLGPEYLSSRQAGGGMKVTYIEGWRAIGLANEVFGYDGWSSEIKQLDIDYIDVNPETGRVSAGVTAIVKVTVHDCGSIHEDVGYGSMEGARTKGDALDKCKKEAVTDGVKRALRNYGNLLGNCIYDKSHIQESSKIKAVKPKFNFSDIYRKDEYLTTALPVTKTESLDSGKLPELSRADENVKREEQQEQQLRHVQQQQHKYQQQQQQQQQQQRRKEAPLEKSANATSSNTKTITVGQNPPQPENDEAIYDGGHFPSSPPMSDPTMGLESLCNDVDFDECFVDDSGVALMSSPHPPADRKPIIKQAAPDPLPQIKNNQNAPVTTPINNERMMQRASTIDRSVSRPIARKGAEHEVVTRKLGPSEDFVRGSSPSLVPELGGFTNVKNIYKDGIKRGNQTDYSESSKRSKSSVQ